MREILFKGKRVDNGKWVEGGLIYHLVGTRGETVKIAKDNDWNNCYFIDNKTIGQYTGLTDKSGAKIFEGDIVKVNSNRIGYIKFLQQEMGYCVVYSNFDTRLGHRNTGGCYDNNNFIEVIGNIFDNPELLK